MTAHKYLDRFQSLLKRIEMWKQLNMPVTEVELDRANDDLKHADELIRLCTSNPDYEVPVYRLKNANHHWKLYSIMNMEIVKKVGEMTDIFKDKK